MTRHSLCSALLDLVFAPVCLACDGNIAMGDEARLICRRCRTRLRPLPPPSCPRCGAPRLRTGRASAAVCGECAGWPPGLRVARSACLLHPPADRIVHQLKYRGWRALARPMAELMAALPLPPDVEEEARLAVPVPTTPVTLRQRGYNQAELLARAYAERTRRQHCCVLERGRAARSQTTLQPAARGANVAGAFRVVAGRQRELAAAHVLLVDDVLTTGATAAECTRTLLAAGARCVSVITFARALDARRLTET
ncbi:MAG: ComF family protein [Gemmatimonadetes bacterium]|nr:ComF family protein [Gemmatimonadota bacterium]